MNRLTIATAAALAFVLSAACTKEPAKSETPPAKVDQPPSAQSAPAPAKAEHVFRGKVEQVDATAKTLTVAGENVEGWMGAMTMTYTPDKPDVLSKVKVGDQITAKVFDGDFSMLHDVQVTTAATK
jgi:Cu/Ag efflux protein CusF